MTRTVLQNAAMATVDRAGTEYPDGHLLIEDGRIAATGAGSAPAELRDGARVIDLGGRALITPGLVNTHHHLYQWASRGLAQDCGLFGWLTTLYPIWGGLDEEITHTAASAGLGWMALSGCTTAADHHYVFPRDGGDVLGAVVAGASRIGVRLHAVRGSMDRGRSDGGLPPDHIVEDIDAALAGTEAAVRRFHDPEPDAMVRVAVGPCSPFSVSAELMRRGAELARHLGVRLHTHLAETLDEEEQCQAEFGRTPVEYAEQLGWLGEDVWLAHGVHLSDSAVKRLGDTGTGVAHCPSSNARLGTGIAPVRDLLAARAPVGLGVDGAASYEAGGLGDELRQALYSARQRSGPESFSARDALRLATAGGARCLGRQHEIGSIEAGKLADLAVWRLDGLGHAGIGDPVAALVFGSLPPLALLLVGGRTVVEDGRLTGQETTELAAELDRASRALLARHGEGGR
jgi:cytosine/adenosine deaminase-related metal-dependent hydrolase